ncbi:MAG: hypothetical protein R2852_02220 [Bacteroidia bacterium]
MDKLVLLGRWRPMGIKQFHDNDGVDVSGDVFLHDQTPTKKDDSSKEIH